jgi:hypothetical protein
MRDTGWFKSTFSEGGSDACVEVRITDTATGVRDSKNPAGSRLTLSRQAFDAFLTGITQAR